LIFDIGVLDLAGADRWEHRFGLLAGWFSKPCLLVLCCIFEDTNLLALGATRMFGLASKENLIFAFGVLDLGGAVRWGHRFGLLAGWFSKPCLFVLCCFFEETNLLAFWATRMFGLASKENAFAVVRQREGATPCLLGNPDVWDGSKGECLCGWRAS